jgi:DNA polymerase I
MEKRRLVILDGYSLLFRAFYGTRFLSTADGRPTNALFGFTNTLLALFNEHKPDALAVALDAPGKTFRHGDFPEYKGTRRETPPELISQLDYSRELIAALNLPCLEVAGYEADDVIGTVSKRGEEAGYEVLIVTGDRDSLQLVDPNVTVMMPGMRGADPSYYTPDAVREKYGFEPQQMVDYKALAGDASDNIPGVPGIGDKSATELVQKFGGVQGILERKQEVPEKFWKKIEPAVDSMLLSQRLATIDREAPVEYAFEPYRIDEGHVQRALAMLESLEFKSQAKRLQAALGRYMTDGATQVTEAAVHGEPIEARLAPGVLDAAALTKWVDGRRYSIVAAPGESQPSMFDQETPEGAFVAVGNEVRQTAMVDAMRLFEAAPARCLGHDVKPFYRRTSAGLEPPAFDAMIAGYVLQSGRASYELDDLVAGYLDSRPRTPAERAASLHPLAEAMEARLAAEGQTRVYAEVELALVPILAEMEGFGIAVDRGYLEQLSATLDASIEQARARVHELAGTEFNIGSPKQIGEVLFEKLQLPGGRKTKTGWATGVEVLSEIEHPVAAAILEYRELTKLKGTYADALPKMIGPDGRIHTSFNQTVAATGRLSSNEPNLQNIPIRSADPAGIRGGGAIPAGQLRLLPNRTPGLGPRLARSELGPGVPGARGRPYRDGRVDVQDRAGRRDQGAAEAGEAAELCGALRRDRLRPLPAARARVRREGRPRAHRALQRAVPDRQGVHDKHRGGGPGEGVHGDTHRPAAVLPGHPRCEPWRAPVRRTASHERPDSRNGGRHDQDGDDPSPTLARLSGHPDAPAGARRTGVRARAGRGRPARSDPERHGVGTAA